MLNTSFISKGASEQSLKKKKKEFSNDYRTSSKVENSKRNSKIENNFKKQTKF